MTSAPQAPAPRRARPPRAFAPTNRRVARALPPTASAASTAGGSMALSTSAASILWSPARAVSRTEPRSTEAIQSGPVTGSPTAISVEAPPTSQTAMREGSVRSVVSTAPRYASVPSSSLLRTRARTPAARESAATSSSEFSAWRPGAVRKTSSDATCWRPRHPRHLPHRLRNGADVNVGDVAVPLDLAAERQAELRRFDRDDARALCTRDEQAGRVRADVDNPDAHSHQS